MWPRRPAGSTCGYARPGRLTNEHLARRIRASNAGARVSFAVRSQLSSAFELLAREIRLVVDATGTITWSDDRARALGFVEGTALRSLLVPGTELKLEVLLRRGIEELVTGWELAMLVEERPATLLFAASPVDGQIAMVASLVSQDVADAVEQGREATAEMVLVNRELVRQRTRLEESNKAIRSLHGELEQQADRLRASAEVKARLVATVSHELRTPLHSILGMSRLLLDGTDGPLSDEQRVQLGFIRSSAEELSTLVNDVLDLAKLDSGTAPLRIEAFDLGEAMSAMRGTMAPLVPADGSVELVFDPVPDVALETDLGKLNQILRNLIANALKFTRRGTVRVTTTVPADDQLVIAVRDTGPGIAPADHVRVFEEFVQLDVSRGNVRGTGLGLPVARKLAALLGGTLELASEVGKGATFTLTIPMAHRDVAIYEELQRALHAPDPARAPVLVVEDDRETVFAYERYLAMAGFQVLPARSTREASGILRRQRPAAILLDVMLEGEDTWSFLESLKQSPDTRDIPVLVCTVMDRESRARALGADELWLKPIDEDKLVRKLQSMASGKGAKVLVIDDDERARYLIAKHLKDTPYQLLEAAHGATGVEMARREQPDVILLDFLLDDVTAFDVIDQLKSDPHTRHIPVIVITAQSLDPAEREQLARQTDAILSKEHLSREIAIQRIRDSLRGVFKTHAPKVFR